MCLMDAPQDQFASPDLDELDQAFFIFDIEIFIRLSFVLPAERFDVWP